MGKQNHEFESQKPSSSSGELTLKPSGVVVVRHEETAAKAPEDKRIHPRRPLPLIPVAPSPGDARVPASPEDEEADPPHSGAAPSS